MKPQRDIHFFFSLLIYLLHFINLILIDISQLSTPTVVVVFIVLVVVRW